MDALPLVTPELKVDLIDLLGDIGGEEVRDAFLTLLEQREQLSAQVYNDLVPAYVQKEYSPLPGERLKFCTRSLMKKRKKLNRRRGLFEKQKICSGILKVLMGVTVPSRKVT